MFDETNPNQNLPGSDPAGGRKEPEDIFSETEGPASAPSAAPRPMASAGAAPAGMPETAAGEEMQSTPVAMQTSVLKKVIIIVVIIIVVAGVGIGGYWYYNSVLKQRLEEQKNGMQNGETEQILQPQVPSEQETVPEVTQPETETPAVTEPEAPVEIDSDNDGLTDKEEQLLRTDPNLVDTDGDGLFDKEEVVKYKTDPLNEDTDGDGYKDGDEVNNGYNPKGSGKLLEELPASN